MQDAKIEETKQILIAITELQTNMRNMSTKIDEISKISGLVLETDQRAKSAHNRIDDLKAHFNEKAQDQKEDYEEKIGVLKEKFDKLDGHITWLWRSFGAGAISFIFSILLFLFTRG